MNPARLVGAAATGLTVAAGLFAGLVAGAPAASADQHGTARQTGVVLVGVPGLAWPDVTAEDMPTLFELAGNDAAASLSVRTIRSRTCTVDGWQWSRPELPLQPAWPRSAHHPGWFR